MASGIEAITGNKDVIFLVVLNGAFVFAADLIRKISKEAKISFIKLASYIGTSSTGKVRELVGLDEDLKGKTVVIIEDIVDTGITLGYLVDQLKKTSPENILIATLLLKKEIFRNNVHLDFVGKEIPNLFVVGYGLDFNGIGRNLPDIYVLEDV